MYTQLQLPGSETITQIVHQIVFHRGAPTNVSTPPPPLLWTLGSGLLFLVYQGLMGQWMSLFQGPKQEAHITQTSSSPWLARAHAFLGVDCAYNIHEPVGLLGVVCAVLVEGAEGRGGGGPATQPLLAADEDRKKHASTRWFSLAPPR